MNKTQVRIIGWSLILLGLFLLSSVILKSIDAESFIAADPIFYIGFILIVAGIVVLAGDIKNRKPTEKKERYEQKGNIRDHQNKPNPTLPIEVLDLLKQHHVGEKNQERK